MKYFAIFLLCCVALSAAAPQFIVPFPGYVSPVVAPVAPAAVVAGPTVVNGFPSFVGGRIIAPGYVGPAVI